MKDQLPPHSVEIEQAVLGACLQSPVECVSDLMVEKPVASWFYENRHQIIFEAIRQLFDAGQPAEITLLGAKLREMGKMEAVGGFPYLSELPDHSPGETTLGFHLEQLKDLAYRRNVIATHTEAIAAAYTKPADEVRAIVEQGTVKLALDEAGVEETSVKGVVRAVINRMEDAVVNRGKLNGVSTGYYDLDKLLRGMKPGQNIILAAATAQGKTSLALNIVERVCVVDGVPTCVFSLEMSREELVLRMACSFARVPSDRAEGGELTENDIAMLGAANGAIYKAPLHIIDRGGLTIAQLRGYARRMVQRHAIKFIVIDYLQLLSGQRRENRTVEVGEISRGVKALAKELQLPILSLAQLNRNADADGGREPRLSDLRESGSIEQDADAVVFIHRPDQSKPDCKLLVKKNRSGRTGSVQLYFNAEITRFENFTSAEGSRISRGQGVPQ